MKRWEFWLAVILLLALVVAPGKSRAQTYEGFVVRVIDGDTIDVRAGHDVRRVRIADIDTPEVGRTARCPLEIELGQKAAIYLRGMILNDVVRVRVRKVDYYRRDFAYVTWWDIDIGQHLIAQGLAKPWLDHHPKPEWCQ